MTFQSKKSAFTLAEILITLLIIGVVASIVVPAVINDSKEAEFNAGVKKAYADLSQALQLIQVNNGGFVNVGTATANSNITLLRNDFCNVMSCIKTDTAKNIFGVVYYKHYEGSSSSGWPATSTYPAAATNNGYLIQFFSYSDCTSFGVNACGYLDLDINGPKGPNMFGKDTYQFYIINRNGTYSIFAPGSQGDTQAPLPTGCASGSGSWGTTMGCTAKRLTDPDNMP